MLKCVKGPQWTAGKHTEGNGRKHLKPVALSTNAKGDLIFLLDYSPLLYFKKRIYFWTSGIFFLFSSSQFFGVFFCCESAGLHSSDTFTCHVEFKADQKGNRRLKCYFATKYLLEMNFRP